ncbi:hypothetical protein Bca4012_054517 [Brassica carinata]|uniref:Uncharacterized protein n=1 Tax=Brassica carinata TaxID=52824 RepID=A0A8X7VW35_BRACI|nr:hypothetical protein Bca52824_012431 [Brassica carinata]
MGSEKITTTNTYLRRDRSSSVYIFGWRKSYSLEMVWFGLYCVALRNYHESLFPTSIAGATYCLVMFALARVVFVSSISQPALRETFTEFTSQNTTVV